MLMAIDKILDLNNIIGDNINYENVNKYGNIKLRNINNGLSLNDTIYYKFLYADINSTKDDIVASINFDNVDRYNKNSVTRRAFESKERNISTEYYMSLLKNITDYYKNNCVPTEKQELIYLAVDGCNSNNKQQDVMLNMGYYDIVNKTPFCLDNSGAENRNKEVSELIKHIKTNKKAFKNVVIVADRLYFNYKLLNFLVNNNIYFIIRSKGDAKNLDINNPLKKNIKDHDIIEFLRSKLRIVKCKTDYEKIFFGPKGKKDSTKKYTLKVTNDCTLITNLIDTVKYPDLNMLNLYRQRWEIETFFKYIKNNFKFQHTLEKNNEQFNRLIICEQIIAYIVRIIEYFYLKSKNIKKEKISKKHKKKVVCSVKINDSLLTTGVFNKLLCHILNSSLTQQIIKVFCETYIKIIKNDLDRHNPRFSQEPYTKWYLKGYSNGAELIKIIEAIINDKIEELNKNLKTKASKIKIIKIETIK